MSNYFTDKIEPHMKGFVGYDLDQTLRQSASGEQFINTPLDQKPIDGALEAIKHFNLYLRRSFDLEKIRIVGVTNQQGVKWGYKSLESCIEEQQQTLELFPQLQYILLCPDNGQTCWKVDRDGAVDVTDPELSGSYRKPGTGMLVEAIAGLPPFEENWFFIGDRDSDKEAAQAAGFGFIWASDWLGGNYVAM